MTTAAKEKLEARTTVVVEYEQMVKQSEGGRS
jgi:hypothetical protein